MHPPVGQPLGGWTPAELSPALAGPCARSCSAPSADPCQPAPSGPTGPQAPALSMQTGQWLDEDSGPSLTPAPGGLRSRASTKHPAGPPLPPAARLPPPSTTCLNCPHPSGPNPGRSCSQPRQRQRGPKSEIPENDDAFPREPSHVSERRRSARACRPPLSPPQGHTRARQHNTRLDAEGSSHLPAQPHHLRLDQTSDTPRATPPTKERQADPREGHLSGYSRAAVLLTAQLL